MLHLDREYLVKIMLRAMRRAMMLWVAPETMVCSLI